MLKTKSLVYFSWLILLLAFASFAKAQDQAKIVVNSFDKIRKSEAALQYFFSRMPKGGDLHNHLTGSVYAETYFDIAVKERMFLDPDSYILYLKEDSSRPEKCIQLSPDMKNLHDWRVRCIDHWSIRNFQTSQAAFPPDEFFFATFGKFGNATNRYLVDFLKELRIRAQAENVQYLEIMATGAKTNNSFITKYSKENDSIIQQIKRKDDFAIKATLETLYRQWEKDDLFQQDIANYSNLIDSLDSASKTVAPEVLVYYQTYASRNVADPIKVYAQLYVGFKTAQKNPKLVGVNIVQAENGDYAIRDYWGHMKMFLMLRFFTKNKIKAAMHAGELCLGLVPPEDLQSHIWDAVTIGGANRIGHGVDIVFEKQAENLLSLMEKRKIAVEINLTSNEFILGVKGDTHPIMVYHENNVPIVLSTDDPGILRTNLTQQFVIAAMRYPELTYSDFKTFVLNSIEYSFMPEKDKETIKKRLQSLLNTFEGEMPDEMNQVFGIQ